MPGQHTEQAFESAIEHHLLSSGGYEKADREAFEPQRGLSPQTFLGRTSNCSPVLAQPALF